MWVNPKFDGFPQFFPSPTALSALQPWGNWQSINLFIITSAAAMEVWGSQRTVNTHNNQERNDLWVSTGISVSSNIKWGSLFWGKCGHSAAEWCRAATALHTLASSRGLWERRGGGWRRSGATVTRPSDRLALPIWTRSLQCVWRVCTCGCTSVYVYISSDRKGLRWIYDIFRIFSLDYKMFVRS